MCGAVKMYVNSIKLTECHCTNSSVPNSQLAGVMAQQDLELDFFKRGFWFKVKAPTIVINNNLIIIKYESFKFNTDRDCN